MAKFTCRVIQDTNGKYHADLCIAGHIVDGLPGGVDYNTLREAIRQQTGIEILKRSQMIFERYNGKSYAMIDATQTRNDCRVTTDEIRVVADYDTGMINVEIIEQGERMNRVAAIECCNLDALAKILDIRGVEHDF